MVIRESVNHVVEGVESGRSYDAYLSHSGPEHLAPTARTVDEVRVAYNHRTDGACQTL